MIVGFTGTQHGMTNLQKLMFVGVLARLCPNQFHHGDCIGADAEADALVREHAPKCFIVIHPPEDETKRAFCHAHKVMPPKPYLDRNRAIVFACEELVAAPQDRVEEIRSGTWMTIRAARRSGKTIHMVWP